MPDSSNGYTESTIHIGGTGVTLIRGGSGSPLLVLHEELGHPGWLSWHVDLAHDHSILVPVHPGFGPLPRADWISSVRDLAGFYSRMLRDMGPGPVDVIGFSLGGWIAAEMAAADSRQFRRMALVAPTGLRPPDGEIMDMFVVTARTYLNASVRDSASAPEFGSLYGGEETPGTVRSLGRRPRRVGPPCLEALHAQPQLGSVAGGHQQASHFDCVGPGRRSCSVVGRASLQRGYHRLGACRFR